MTPVEALQHALAAEHGAVASFAHLGARARGRFRELIREAHTTHLERRDELRAMIADHGQTPVSAEVGYQPPAKVRPGASDLEQTMLANYALVVENTSGPERRWALAALDDSAVRAVRLGGQPSTWPGEG